MSWLEQVFIAIDQFFNTVFKGWADETISSRCWRLRADRWWGMSRKVVDGLFFWQPNHCQTAYESELNRRQLPPEFRQPVPQKQ
ncbi:MAG: pseudouridine synthase [Geobacter sp.]|nr:pseudouridine synthase [Geobacter sp.]